MRDLLTVKDVASITGLSIRTVWRYKYDGLLKEYQRVKGRSILFTKGVLCHVAKLHKQKVARSGRPNVVALRFGGK